MRTFCKTTRRNFALPCAFALMLLLAPAAHCADAEELYQLGIAALDFKSGRADVQKATVHLTRAAELGHPEAQYHLGFMLFMCPQIPEPCPVTQTEAIDWLSKAASNGHPIASFLMSGSNPPRLIPELLVSKDSNAAEAQYHFGMKWLKGIGMYPNEHKGMQLIQNAAAHAHLGALRELDDRSVPPPLDRKSIATLTTLAKAGNSAAQYHLGLAYANGDGELARDARKATDWIRRSAQSGYARGQLLYGLNLLDGDGVAKNESEGTMLIEQAAQANETRAQLQLSLLLSEGRGTKKDPVRALAWSIVSERMGNKQARMVQNILRLSLTPDSITAGEAMAEQLLMNMETN